MRTGDFKILTDNGYVEVLEANAANGMSDNEAIVYYSKDSTGAEYAHITPTYLDIARVCDLFYLRNRVVPDTVIVSTKVFDILFPDVAKSNYTQPACECGAHKIGCGDFCPGHSSWCPVKEMV
jgi:hypothetical protein